MSSGVEKFGNVTQFDRRIESLKVSAVLRCSLDSRPE